MAIAQKPVKKCGSINIEFGQLFGRIPGLFNILYDREEGIVYGMVRTAIGRDSEAVAIEMFERFLRGVLLGRWRTLYPFRYSSLCLLDTFLLRGVAHALVSESIHQLGI